MTRDHIRAFITDNYCNIDKVPSLPKIVGQMPAKERLIKRKEFADIIQKAKENFGPRFSLFLELNFSKASVVKNKNRLWFFYLQFDDWETMYCSWEVFKNQPD